MNYWDPAFLLGTQTAGINLCGVSVMITIDGPCNPTHETSVLVISIS